MDDYTGSLCFHLPKGESTLIDIESYEMLCAYVWRCQRIGKRIGPNKEKCKRIVRARNQGGIVFLHRAITNAPDGLVVDHINHDTTDNRIVNLRVCTVRENNLNSRGQIGASSRFKGVAWEKRSRKWKVITGTKDRKVYLGSFDCEIEAARVYNEFAKANFGPTAYLNPV